MSAEDLMREADKKVSGSGNRFLSFLGGGPKYDEAAELYRKAGHAFKLDKQFEKASEAYRAAAAMFQKADNTYEEGTTLKEAADMMAKVDIEKAGALYENSAKVLLEKGKFDQGARVMEKFAETLYAEKKLDLAMVYYKKAAEYYDAAEFGKHRYNEIMNKWADLASMKSPSYYDEAYKVYEDIALKALNSDIGKYTNKKYFLKAIIILLAKGDAVTAEVAIDKYCSLDPRFAKSLEATLCKKITECLESKDAEAYEDALGEYDNICTFDPWHNFFWNKIQAFMNPKREKGTSGGPAPMHHADSDSDLC